MAREVYCHAVNLFFEARGETPLGQRWVLDVVRNRVNSDRYPETYCGVITQYRQFSWYEERKDRLPEDPINWEYYILGEYHENFIELAAWRSSFAKAFEHYLFSTKDHTNGSLYYMTVERFHEIGYFNNTIDTGVVGSHIFFKPCKRKTECYHF